MLSPKFASHEIEFNKMIPCQMEYENHHDDWKKGIIDSGKMKINVMDDQRLPTNE